MTRDELIEALVAEVVSEQSRHDIMKKFASKHGYNDHSADLARAVRKVYHRQLSRNPKPASAVMRSRIGRDGAKLSQLVTHEFGGMTAKLNRHAIKHLKK
jgi:hypothetical protein